MGQAATAETEGVRCKVLKTPRPGYPWKIEILAPHVADDRTCYFFATEEKALEAVRQRNWKLHRPAAGSAFLRFVAEFTVVCLLLSPVVYYLFREPISFLMISAPALCLNPYTTAVTTVMFSACVYPFIKVILLMVARPKSDFLLGSFIARIIVYLIMTWGFCFLFMGMLPNVPTAIETLEAIEASRAQMVAQNQIFPGMTEEEYYAAKANSPLFKSLNTYRDPAFSVFKRDVRQVYNHATDEEFVAAQKIYARLKEQAAKEAKSSLKGKHVYKVILNKAHDLWIERQAQRS